MATPQAKKVMAPPPRPAVIVSAPAPVCSQTPMSLGGDGDAENKNYAVKNRPDKPGQLCQTAVTNIQRDMRAILGAAVPRGRVSRVHAWNRRTTPRRFRRVAKRFALERQEKRLLRKNGFVVTHATMDSYAWAYHEIYQSELPIYVSIDSILHAIYIGNDSLIADVETQRLIPILNKTLESMHCALPAAAKSYPPNVAKDVDLYLTVARSLLAGKSVKSVLASDAVAASLVSAANAARGMSTVKLFGRDRKIDFSQFKPRGHYTKTPLAEYFRAAMWLSRLEFNLVSRSSRSSAASHAADPRETPREAVVALALVDLVGQANASKNLAALEEAWATFAGKREDVSFSQLAALRVGAKITKLADIGDAAKRLKRVIGGRFVRTTRFHYMPMGTTTLPVISTMLGPRLTPDSQATGLITEPKVPGRHDVDGADLAYVLGHDRALAYLKKPLAKFPNLRHQLKEARATVYQPLKGVDLYSAWLRAIRALAVKPKGAVPSFMKTPAFADLRMNSALVAYGQLRHNNVLMAGQSYDQGGCQIPDGYVEPAPDVYEALIKYAARGVAVMAKLDPKDNTEARAYFTKVGRTLRTLLAIVRTQLANRRLSKTQQRFLAMVSEMTPGGTGGPPTYTGWYFDLFRNPEEALKRSDFIAYYFTSGYENKVSYIGATDPRIGIFVIDTGGRPRVAVGPVARGYQVETPLTTRLTDEAARKLTNHLDLWARNYTRPAPPVPDLSVSVDTEGKLEVSATAKAYIGRVTIELLDHHRRRVAIMTRVVRKGVTKFPFKQSAKGAEAGRVSVGKFHSWFEIGWSGGGASFGSMAIVPDEG